MAWISQLNLVIKVFILTSEYLYDNPIELTPKDVQAAKLKAYVDFKQYQKSFAWDMRIGEPIRYLFASNYTEVQKDIIRKGINIWQSRTCLKFEEVPQKPKFSDFVLLKKAYKKHDKDFRPIGCYAPIGKYYQLIYGNHTEVSLVDGSCITVSSVAHEIGHVIGINHQQRRVDSTDHLILLPENLYRGFIPQFQINIRGFLEYPNFTALGLPYDLGSVMHYPGQMFSIKGKPTLKPKNALFAQTMGSGYGIGGPSFYDIKFANMLYCTDNCKGARPYDMDRFNQCKKGGYVDVTNSSNCGRCICPDGFTGNFCQNVSVGIGATCGGLLTSKSGIITSPGYNTTGYESGQQCSWLIKAPKGKRVKLEFLDDVEIPCFGDSFFEMYRGAGPGSFSRVCKDWVEVRMAKDLANTGPRFCCTRSPKVKLVSETEQMLVLFRANTETLQKMIGFKAHYDFV